jgi:CheY-like chemotaxis protein
VRAEGADPARIPQPRGRQRPDTRHHERVLVVDDNPVNLQVAAAMLQHLGYPHTGVGGGALALQALENAHASGQPYAVVLLDSHMPDLDGLQTAQAIVQRWGDQAPVLIGVSASTLGSDRQRSLDAGMSDYLPKPLLLETLASTLRHWCGGNGGPAGGQAAGTIASPEAVLDEARWQMLAEVDDGQGALREAIAGDFLTALPGRCEALTTAAASADVPALQQAAHLLKGAAQNLGAVALGACCEQLETQAMAGRIDQAALAELPGHTQALRARLQGG